MKKAVEEIPNFKKIKDEDKGGKKTAIIIFVLLMILLILLVVFFIHNYLLTKKKIDNMFNDIKEVDPDSEFYTNSFLSLTNACIGKISGDSCEFESNGETVHGICKTSGENNTVCIEED